VYEKEIDTGKGPRLFLPWKRQELIATDMLAIKDGGAFWVEAKTKSAFTLHRKTNRWTTGIDAHHWSHYLRLPDISPWPIWLMFLHYEGQAKDSPPGCPTGLFGGEIQYLADNIHHTHANWGRHGMVYWASDTLKRLASLDDITDSDVRFS
jgi:hypothetical protein